MHTDLYLQLVHRWAVTPVLKPSGLSGRAGTTPWDELNFPISPSRGYKNDKHQRKQRSLLLSCFFCLCQGLSCMRELSHTKLKGTCHPLGPLQCHIWCLNVPLSLGHTEENQQKCREIANGPLEKELLIKKWIFVGRSVKRGIEVLAD